jgi:excisionase family DNA binding protein
MPDQLTVDEQLSEGVRRLILAWIDQIVTNLTDPAIDRDEGIHEARKDCKRVRAALRLLRDEIGDPLYHQENIRFRDAARGLSTARDSWVLIDSLDKVILDHASGLPNGAFEGIRNNLLSHYEDTLAGEGAEAGQLQAILATLRAATVSIEHLSIQRDDFSTIRGGLRRVYRNGRRAMDQAYAHQDPAIFHEWRKQVKYLWHQVEILVDLWPNLLIPLGVELHTLSDYLGCDHDLVVLRQWALGHPQDFADKGELMLLVTLIDQHRLALEALARPLGERLYFDTPASFTRRLETCWQAWRRESHIRQSDLVEQIYLNSLSNAAQDRLLLTTSEVAAYLATSPERVRKLIYESKLPADKVGAIWVIKALVLPSQRDDPTLMGVLLSTREAAARLNTTPDRLRQLIQAGEIKATKLGRSWVVAEDDLESQTASMES